MAHPHADHTSLREILKAANAEETVAVLSAESLDAYARRPLQVIMKETFKLEHVERSWKQFIVRFSPVLSIYRSLAPVESFFVRTLLIHEYRRVLLRDPNLPEALLPVNWPGLHARHLCGELYGVLLAPSELFLQSHVETADGALVKTPRAITRRLSTR